MTGAMRVKVVALSKAESKFICVMLAVMYVSHLWIPAWKGGYFLK